MMRRTAIKRQSPRRHDEREKRRDVVMAVNQRDVYCRATVAPQCGGHLDVHERVPRGHGGDPNDIDNCVLVCRNCHEWIHSHTRAARELGWYAS